MDKERRGSREENIIQRETIHRIDYPKLWTWERLEEVAELSKRLDKEVLETPLLDLDLRGEGLGVVKIKDESVNPTGTHKDRLALAVAQQFAYDARMLRDRYQAAGVQSRFLDPDTQSQRIIERYSLISSGHGGMALASAFKKYNLPPPKLLIDSQTRPETIMRLKNEGAEIFAVELGKTSLKREDILRLTDNMHGRDLTSENLEPDGYWRIYYSQLAKELLSEGADYIYAPYGSGNLFEGIISTQTLGENRLTNILGSEPEDLQTKAVMLAAPSKPFKYFDPSLTAEVREDKLTGERTGVYKISESLIGQAHDLYTRYGIKAGYSSSAALALYIIDCRAGKIKEKDKTIIINTGRGIVQQDW